MFAYARESELADFFIRADAHTSWTPPRRKISAIGAVELALCAHLLIDPKIGQKKAPPIECPSVCKYQPNGIFF
jgi:hypothetical protein